MEKFEKLQLVSAGLLLSAALIICTQIASSRVSNDIISVTGSAYEIVKSDSGTLSFNIVVKRYNKQEAYSAMQ